MMRAARRPTRRVPISRYLLAFLVAALIFLSASSVTRRGETASNSEKPLASGSTSIGLLSLLYGSPVAPNPLEPLLVPLASDDVVISQVYGGGGNSGSSYQNDYVELFNQGTTTISLNGWTINYTSATGNTWQATTLSGSLAPGHYYLVQEAQGAGGTLQLPLPDASGTTQLNSTDGKVALLNGSGCLNGTFDPTGYDCEWEGTVIVDLVGYGSGTTSYEGNGPTIGPSNTSAILRGANGCIDLNDNKSDFDTGLPTPRNSSILATQCSQPNPSTTVVISEFRTRGPSGGNDEFIELYNKTAGPINIGGWKLKASNNSGLITTRFTIPANTTLPAHRHYLATNNNSSLGYTGTVSGDQTYGVGITDNGGLAITLGDDTIVDQAGLSIGSAFKEGRVLDPFTTNTDRSYERKLGGVSGSEQDSGDSRSDFLIRMTSDPQNLQSIPVPDSGPPVATGVKIVHIDVGQGDATLIIGPTRALLFDAGITGSGTVIRNVLNANGITSLDYFVAGHYHADHVGAIDEVMLGGITVGTSYDRGGTYSTQAFTEYSAAVGANRSTIALNQQIDLGGGVILTCIAVGGQTNHGTVTSSDENDRSIALVLRYGTFDYLIASDSTGGGSSTANVESFYARDAGDVDVLHVNHHGSNTSTNQTLVNTVRAQQAVISLGNGNSYGHPTQAVLDRLSASSIMDTIWQTEAGTGATSSKVRVGGNITFASDGTTYSVTNSLNGLNLSYSTDGITGAPLPGPQAVTAGPYSGNAGASISFNGGGSTSPGSTITSYQWNFGDNRSGTGVTPSHSYNASGTYTVTLTVTDSAGAMSSAQTTVTINQSPTVSVASPSEGAAFTAPASITITANAGDNDGTISQVEFFQATTLVGTASSAPFTVTWSGVVQGTYSISAKATDNSGAVTSSAPVNVTVNPPNQPPTVVLTSPTNNAAFSAGSTVTLGANASDTDGTISKVEFFQGAAKLGEDLSSPYTLNWENVSAGSYSLSARATDNANELVTSNAVNILVGAQAKQYVAWSSITNGTDLGNGSVRKTSTGTWDFSANSVQTLLAGDGYFESTSSSYNQSIALAGVDGTARTLVIGTGGWAAIYENGVEVAATSGHGPSQTISPHGTGDRYRLEITKGLLRYVRYRGISRSIVYLSSAALPLYPIRLNVASSPQNAEWQRSVVAQLTRTATWSSISGGEDLGNGTVRKTSSNGWGFRAIAVQKLLTGDSYVEATASSQDQAISLSGVDGNARTLLAGTNGWAAIYENGVEVAASAGHIPSETISSHAAGDRYRLEITSGTLRYVRFRSAVREVLFTSTGSLPVYPLSLNLDSSPQSSEWQNTVFAQLSQTVTWSYISNGIDLGNGSARKTSTGVWDFSAGPRQHLVQGNGYFESTASYWNHSINMAGANGDRTLIAGTGGWAAVYENGVEVASTSPMGNLSGHASGDRYRLEITQGKLRYVRYRANVRSIIFTSANVVPAYTLGFSLGASIQNSEWQNTVFSDNIPEHNDASFVSQSVPATMAPGQTYSVSVTMRNTGASTWTPDSDYQLVSENLPDNQRWGVNRVNLTTIAPPGSNGTFNFTVTAPATGSHSFQWRMVQQGVETFGISSTNVNVQTVNGVPNVTLTSPANAAVFSSGSNIALTASATDSDGTITKVQFLQGSTILGEDTVPPYTFDWSNVSIGNYAITARATDNGGAMATSSSANVVVNTSNQSPVADPNGSYSALSGSPVHFDGSLSTDSDGIIASYQWNFGDSTSGTGEAVSHAYSSVGTYSAVLTVTDNLGATAVASTNVVVTSPSNQLPVANPGGPYTAVTGTPVQFNGAGSSDNDGSISLYHWEFADSSSAQGVAPTHTFTAPGTHLVSLKVTDNGGATHWSSINIKVAKAPGGNQTEANPNDVSWDPGNRDSMDDPNNDRGNKPNDSKGNNNFQITAPVLSLPGRGLDLNLNLIYNSLVWNKAGNEMAYDLDQDWPAAGWQLGFGKMVAMGTAGALLIEPDGTRHGFTGVPSTEARPGGTVQNFIGRTIDGSAIEYRCEFWLQGITINKGIARYPNGMTVTYQNYSTDLSVPHSYLYPTQIVDANGNRTFIKYLWDLREPRIEHIVDSVGRVIKFHYDTQKRLTRVTAPGLADASGNPTTQTFIRLHYSTKALDMNGAFTTSVTRVRNPSPTVIDAIYYPATGTGYWLPDGAYSKYGMLMKVEEQRGMGFSGSIESNEQGTVTQGTMTKRQEYDYPSVPSALGSAPTFGKITETWDGGISGTETKFLAVSESGPNESMITITNPDRTKSIHKSYSFPGLSDADPNKFKNGLVKEEQILGLNDHLLQKTVFFWEVFEKTPRLQRQETTDEQGNVLKTEYGEYGPNNSVGKVIQRDYDNSIIRTTRSTFVTYSDSDIDLHIGSGRYWPRRINLIDSVKVFEGDESSNQLASYEKYTYDAHAATLQAYPADTKSTDDLFQFGESRQPGGISGLVMHSGGFNPLPFSSGGNGENYITKRGNLTSVTTYADTTDVSNPGQPITETRTYDMVGNVVASSKLCCEQISSVFELNMQYAFPGSQTRGSSDPNSLHRITTSATYDLKTGLQLSQTDVNGRMSKTTYDPISLRPTEITSPTNARTSFEYDDVALKFTQTTRLSPDAPIAGKTVKYLNGLGKVRREEALAVQGINGSSDIWDVVTTTFDQFGRLSKQSRPYRGSDGQHWKEVIYDSVGRVAESREPAIPAGGGGEEASTAGGGAPAWGGGEPPTAEAGAQAVQLGGDIKPTTKHFYNEAVRPQGASTDPGQTTRTVDPWNRWRWMRLDSSGRLAEVVEPNPAGGTGFQTKYTYDTLGKLTRVEQGDQIRRFRYDSLGRLTHQKLAETSPTLNSAGQWDETGNPEDKWSNVFTYDQRSNMITSTDARGVKTTFKYKDNSNTEDPLNRLQSISYDLSGVPSSLTVLPAATIGYQYRTRTSVLNRIDLTQVKQIVVTDVSTEDYDYDNHGRVEIKRFTFAGKTQPMTTTYAYDNLDRLEQVTYPEQYHDNAENPARKIVTQSYDTASRLGGLKVNNINYGSQITYNPSSQVTSLEIGMGANKISESYSYEPPTGLVSTQTVSRGATTLMNLHYEYRKEYCEGPGLCMALPESYLSTGQVTRVTNSAPGQGKTQHFSYDSLGRLIKADQSYYVPPPSEGIETDWTQTYSYDRFGNRTGVVASNTSGVTPVPRDGIQSLTFDIGNRITTAGFSYDPAGNQLQNNTGQSFVYDAAGRLAKVKNQSAATVATYIYGASNRRLITQSGPEASTDRTYYLWEGNSVIAEYSEQISASMPKWAKNYIYLGGRLLATEEPNVAGGELVQYHHPDRLGTRLVTNNVDTTSFTQTTLPYGTALDAYSSGATNRRFTSYDRSATTGLDYAVNRQYDSRQGRFTQPDPLGMGAANLADPQSLNMYSYVGNDPMNRVDPDGQFWGALFRFIGGLFSSLKPNIISGSFAYGNRPPVSVSFTTNFQTIGVGVGGIGILARGEGQWLPDLVAHVIKTLADPACAEFSKSILDAVSNKKNPVFPAGGTLADVFHAFMNQPKRKRKHVLFPSELPKGSLGYGNPVGSIRKSTGSIATPGIPRADDLIAELFHHAGRNKHYTDRQLADAVRLFPKYSDIANSALEPEINIYDDRYVGHKDWTEANEGGYSTYFHYAQYNICKTGQPNEGLRRLLR